MKNIDSDIEQYAISCGGDAIIKFNKHQLKTLQTGLSPEFKNIMGNTAFIYKFCKKNKIEIIHSHHRYFDLLAYLVSKLYRVKTVTTVHSKVLGKKLFSYKADRFIAVSNTIREHIIRNFGVNNSKITVINNFVDQSELPAKFPVKDLKEKPGIPVNKFILTFLGRLSKEKGIDVLLRTFKNLQNEFTDLVLLLIGDGEEKSFVQDFIRQNNLNVKLIEPVENIFDYYNISDIIVLPSRVDPFPVVMLETGMMTKPFIASKVDGISEFIEDKINGLLITPENEEELYNAVKDLINNPALRRHVAENLHLKVMTNYTTKSIIPIYKKFYESLLNDKRKN
jgi:glycosyltransferase involved in cell wall biosynthesis